MENINDYIAINKACWNARKEHHIASDFYKLEDFMNGTSSLNDIELHLLDELKGKKVLHLQCHFGQDSLSLARLGAEVTGIDLSDKAIDKAKELATLLNLNTQFICCNIYDLPEHLNEKFDIVFTSYGTIGWIPDLGKWASIITQFLKQGGEFVFAEFHPFVWMYDNDFTRIQYSYFNVEPIVETENGTYADKNAAIITESMGWNHPISDVLNSLIKNGLSIEVFNEYDYSPYNIFPDMDEFEKGKFRMRLFENKLPLVYAIKALKSKK